MGVYDDDCEQILIFTAAVAPDLGNQIGQVWLWQLISSKHHTDQKARPTAAADAFTACFMFHFNLIFVRFKSFDLETFSARQIVSQ